MRKYEKKCPMCKFVLPISNFFTQKDRKNGSSLCKKCFSKYCMDRWSERKVNAILYKGGKCVDCGYNSHPSAMQFHHLDPDTKEMTWNKMRLVSIERMKSELDKCVLLCANCHAIRHSNQDYLVGPA